MKKIIDKNGNPLAQKPDYTLGRLEQGDEPDTLIYKTWADFPPTDAEGNPINLFAPTAMDRLEAQMEYTSMMTDTMLPGIEEE